MHICIIIYISIAKYTLYDITFMYAFMADLMVLEDQFVHSSQGMTVSPALSIP